MAVESDVELAGFFNPNEFGTRLSIAGVEFNGMDTTGFTSIDPASIVAGISQVVPRIICARDSVPEIGGGDLIEFLEDSPHNSKGSFVTVNDLQFKGSLVVIHYHKEF